MPFPAFWDFFEKILMSSNPPPVIFLIFCNKLDFPLLQVPHFTVFRFVKFFRKRKFFRLKIEVFSGSVRYIRILCFEEFFFSNLFLSKPPLILLETKCFASIEDSFGFSALCDWPEIFIKKCRKFSSLIFFYFERISLYQSFVVSSWGKSGFRVLFVSLRVFFGSVKLMKF